MKSKPHLVARRRVEKREENEDTRGRKKRTMGILTS